MPTRFWEMASGSLIFILFQKRASIEKILEKVPPLLILILIIVVMYIPISFVRESTIAVVILSALLIASLKRKTISSALFTNPRVVYVGLISYSLYLWHWGILSISRWTIGIHWWTIPFQITLIFGIAAASYRYLETPFRRGNFFRKRWHTFTVGIGVLICIAGGLFTIGEPLKGKIFMGKKITPFPHNDNLTFGDKCHEQFTQAGCYFFDNKSNKTIWILGDSHAKALYLFGENLAKSLRMNLKLYTGSGTPFPPVGHYRNNNKYKDLQALSDFEFVEKELNRKVKVGDIIFIAMRLPYHFRGTYYEFPSSDFKFINKDGSFGSQENYFDNWISSLENFANIANKQNAKIIIQTPTPEWVKEKNKLCSTQNKQWFNSMNPRDCQIKSDFFINEKTGIYRNLFKKLYKLSITNQNIYLFDTYKFVCPESTCSFSKDGKDIYRDDDHISYEWARDELAPEIYKFIKTINY